MRAETDLGSVPSDIEPLALRLVHACADPTIVADLRWSKEAMAAGQRALRGGAPILADCEMVAHGITGPLLAGRSEVWCVVGDPAVAALARERGWTRSAAAVETWRDRLPGAVVAIGNAPTALFRLLELVAEGSPRPALVLGFPVGFIGAAEAKMALAENPFDLEFVTLLGRRGGSALAAAAVNALAATSESA